LGRGIIIRGMATSYGFLSWRKRFWEWKRVKEEELLSEASLSQNVIDMKIWRPSPRILGKLEAN
jgi:hypothetical protein